jgi:hypothetical protein
MSRCVASPRADHKNSSFLNRVQTQEVMTLSGISSNHQKVGHGNTRFVCLILNTICILRYVENTRIQFSVRQLRKQTNNMRESAISKISWYLSPAAIQGVRYLCCSQHAHVRAKFSHICSMGGAPCSLPPGDGMSNEAQLRPAPLFGDKETSAPRSRSGKTQPDFSRDCESQTLDSPKPDK